MDVKLTKDLEDFVAQKVRAGGYSDASEVMREALRELRNYEDPAQDDSQELAELLLAAVRGPHAPLTSKDFDDLRRRARRKSSKR
jgi:putative addiction module CopG family antidote